VKLPLSLQFPRQPFKRVELLEAEETVEVIICGDEQVDLESLMQTLGEKGIKKLMLEGGSTLNYSMFQAGLVSEVKLCIAPMTCWWESG